MHPSHITPPCRGRRRASSTPRLRAGSRALPLGHLPHDNAGAQGWFVVQSIRSSSLDILAGGRVEAGDSGSTSSKVLLKLFIFVNHRALFFEVNCSPHESLPEDGPGLSEKELRKAEADRNALSIRCRHLARARLHPHRLHHHHSTVLVDVQEQFHIYKTEGQGDVHLDRVPACTRPNKPMLVTGVSLKLPMLSYSCMILR